MKKIQIDILKGLKNGKSIRVVSGRDEGATQRKILNMDQYDNMDAIIEIIIPKSIVFISSSFFLGLFGDSIRKCGSRENFYSKFVFACNPLIRKSIDVGINDALTKVCVNG